MTFDAKRILITGAGGYIGGSVERLLARSNSNSLILLDWSEEGLVNFQGELRECPAHCEFVLGDAGDYQLIVRLLQRRNAKMRSAPSRTHSKPKVTAKSSN